LPSIAGPSFDELFEQRYLPMVRLAYALVGSREIAEELVQDAFARVYERWRRVDQPAAYLRTAVVNGCKNEHRRRRTRKRLAADPEAAPAAPPASIDFLDELRVLSARQRTAVVLRYHEGLGEAEIAAAMGVRPGAVKSTLHRALELLRTQVEP
jgi:RNA polymerase sigma-70 factor (sigma-E family)